MKYNRYSLMLALLLAFNSNAETNGKMGSSCPTGKLAFYAEMMETGAEEKLCLLNEKQGVFYTKTSETSSVANFKTDDVVRKTTKGEIGTTIVYDFTLDKSDVFSFMVFKGNDGPFPQMAYLDINGNLTEMNKHTVIVN